MTNPQGTPVWFEHISPDPDAAQTFYTAAIGWTASDAGMPDIDYHLLAAPDGDAIAGLMKQPEGMVGNARWFGYLGVDDVDVSVTGLTTAGATVHMPPTTLDGVGRMAMLADPQGAAFYVMRGEQPSRAFQSSDAAQPGHGVWFELTSPDPAAAIAFYRDTIGIRQEGAMPMGELGDYSFLHAGATCIGAVMGPVPGAQPGWLPYFLTDDIDAAAARVTAHGGEIVQGPDPIPGGAFSLTATDPQGARVGLVGPRK